MPPDQEKCPNTFCRFSFSATRPEAPLSVEKMLTPRELQLVRWLYHLIYLQTELFPLRRCPPCLKPG